MSGTFVLPKITTPAFFSRVMESASLGAMLSFNCGAPQVVGVPATS